jgi:enamine deaminase RidA (YjgF/YER057c/UK114 family)
LKTIHRKVHVRLLVVFALSLALVAQNVAAQAPAAQAQVRAVVPVPASAQANHFYSPGVDAGDYLYISGQGSRRPDGSSPATFEAQVRQALDNVKAIVESAGLTK